MGTSIDQRPRGTVAAGVGSSPSTQATPGEGGMVSPGLLLVLPANLLILLVIVFPFL